MPLSTTWRCRMPVRVRIHSSLVSTIFSRSALVITLGGRKPATPVIFAAMRCDISPLAGFASGTKEKEVYAMPRIGHKSCAQSACNKISEAKQIADFYEEQLIIAVGWTALIENRWRRNRLIERQVVEAAVVAEIDRGAGVQQIREQNVGRELLGGRNRPAGVAPEIGLQIEELRVGERRVVV